MIWANALAHLSTTVFFVLYQSDYLDKVLGLDKTTAGFVGSASCALNILFRIACGQWSDRMQWLSERGKMLLFNTSGTALAGVALVAFLLIDGGIVVSVGLFALCYSLLSTIGGGFYKCASLTGGCDGSEVKESVTIFAFRQHSHFLIASVQLFRCVLMLALPLVFALFVKVENQRADWLYGFAWIGVANIVVISQLR